MFPLHLCRPNVYTIEISVLLESQFYNIFTNFPSIILKAVTNILKIYELPKIYDTSKLVHNNHLPGQFYVTTSSGF